MNYELQEFGRILSRVTSLYFMNFNLFGFSISFLEILLYFAVVVLLLRLIYGVMK